MATPGWSLVLEHEFELDVSIHLVSSIVHTQPSLKIVPGIYEVQCVNNHVLKLTTLAGGPFGAVKQLNKFFED